MLLVSPPNSWPTIYGVGRRDERSRWWIRRTCRRAEKGSDRASRGPLPEHHGHGTRGGDRGLNPSGRLLRGRFASPLSRQLLAAIERSDIPLRFEPGAVESVAQPVTEMLQAWISNHLPQNDSKSEFDDGYRAFGTQLLAELSGADLQASPPVAS